MVVRIHNLGRWAKVGDNVLELPGKGQRKVKVELNCAGETRVDVVELDKPDAPATFMWAGRGLVELEFWATGLVQLVCVSEDDVYYFTNEREGQAVRNIDAKSFTKIANRRARNPELDAIMLRAEINMNRRLARLEMEMERKYGGIARRIDLNTGEIIDADSDGHGGGNAGEAKEPASVGSASAEGADTGKEGAAGAANSAGDASAK